MSIDSLKETMSAMPVRSPSTSVDIRTLGTDADRSATTAFSRPGTAARASAVAVGGRPRLEEGNA
jgi:hypothetical protein